MLKWGRIGQLKVVDIDWVMKWNFSMPETVDVPIFKRIFINRPKNLAIKNLEKLSEITDKWTSPS